MGPAAHLRGMLYCRCLSPATVSLLLLGGKVEFIRTGVEKGSFMDNSNVMWVFGILLLKASNCKFFLNKSKASVEQQSLLQRFPDF